MNDLTPEEALQEVIPVVMKNARTREQYGIEADDIAQEALIGLYRAFCRDVPDTPDEREKLAVTCTKRSAIQLYRYTTRQSRDASRTHGADCLRCNEPLFEPTRESDVDDLIESSPEPEVCRSKLAGDTWKEIAKKFGGNERNWRYRLRKQFSSVLEPV